MRKHWLGSIGLSALLAVGLTFTFHPGLPAQESEKTIEIILEKGQFVFKGKDKDVTIKEKQSIKWVSSVKGKHRLIPADENVDAFKNTGDFIIPKSGTTPDSATQRFDNETKKAINYKCFFHPSMKGTIAVTK